MRSPPPYVLHRLAVQVKQRPERIPLAHRRLQFEPVPEPLLAHDPIDAAGRDRSAETYPKKRHLSPLHRPLFAPETRRLRRGRLRSGVREEVRIGSGEPRYETGAAEPV